MKKYCIGKTTFETLENAFIELKYYVLENEYDENDTKFKEYGIEIEKNEFSKIERSQVTNITTNQTRIDDIVKTLMNNSVTPVHLHDVIVDML